MELLLILIYVSICYVIFKVFRIPVNQWSLATAALGGIIGIALLLLIMNYNHPFTKNARIYFAVTPVLPTVQRPRDRGAGAGERAAQGRGRAVPHRPEAVRIRRRAEEGLARGSRAEREAAQGLARPGDRSGRKEPMRSSSWRSRTTTGKPSCSKRGSSRRRRSIPITRNLETARQSLTGARAEEERARLAYSSNIDGVNTTVARLRAELADAAMGSRADRDAGAGGSDSSPRSPCGRAMYVVPAPLRPVDGLRQHGQGDQELGAAFQQNSLQRVKAGDDAEVAFDAVPGRVFKGKVRLVLDAIAAGQMQPTGALVDFGARTAGGRALAVIDITDDMSAYQIPLGAAAQVAIYTEHWHHVSLLRKILLRMRSWQNYIFLEGH